MTTPVPASVEGLLLTADRLLDGELADATTATATAAPASHCGPHWSSPSTRCWTP